LAERLHKKRARRVAAEPATDVQTWKVDAFEQELLTIRECLKVKDVELVD